MIPLYRFVACLQALIVDAPDNQPFITSQDSLWSAVSLLADDTVVGVRIGIARLARVASGSLTDEAKFQKCLILPSPAGRFQSGGQQPLLDLIRHLSLDSSHDVRSYVADSLNAVPTPEHSSRATSAETAATRPSRRDQFATFSRPPSHSSPRMFSGASLHGDVNDEMIRRGLTRSATANSVDINSNSPLPSISTLGTALPEEGNFTRPARTNPGSAEPLSPPDSSVIPVLA